TNLELLAGIARTAGVPCRLAGGISRVGEARRAIDRGFAGVLFSSAVFGDDELLREIAALGDRGIVEIEARAGFLAPRGGDPGLVAVAAGRGALAAARAAQLAGVRGLYLIDLTAEGRLAGPPLALVVAGNHDRAVARDEDLDFFNPPAAIAAKMHQRWLSSAERDMLAALPRTLETSDVTLCHGSLRDPLWEYVTNPRSAAASLGLASTSHCCAGHTHVPSLFRGDAKGQPGRVRYDTPYALAPRAFVNPGSVGQPRDGDPRA